METKQKHWRYERGNMTGAGLIRDPYAGNRLVTRLVFSPDVTQDDCDALGSPSIAAAPALADALSAMVAASALSPGDCYDASGRPNANWGAIDRATDAARAALASAGVAS